MLSYLAEFNLRVSGEEAEKYLTTILREWPALYAELAGVQGTLLLANAFALAGEYTYHWRVDMESFKTLQVIDAALKSEDSRWRKARAKWFELRTGVRARLLRLDSNAQEPYYKIGNPREGLIHYVLSYGPGGLGQEAVRASNELKERLVEVWGALDGVNALQHFTAVIQPFNGGRHELWARLVDLSALDGIRRANDIHVGQILRVSDVTSRLFGELREVDGALLAGA